MTRLTAYYNVAQKLIKLFGEARTLSALEKYFDSAYIKFQSSNRHMFEYIYNAETADGEGNGTR
jgi:hypothetical protein